MSYFLRRSRTILKVMKGFAFLIIVMVVCLLPTAQVVADAELDEYCITGGDCALYDPDACGPADSSASTSTVTAGGGGEGPVYMMGDSITFGAEKDLKQEFADKPAMEIYISGRGARSFVSPGMGGDSVGTKNNSFHNGIDQLKVDKDHIAKSKTVVIALGTNAEAGENTPKIFKEKAQAALKYIESLPGDTPKIYWVNLFQTKTNTKFTDHKSAYNKFINEELPSMTGYPPVNIINADDHRPRITISENAGIHPDAGGYKKYAAMVADTIKKPIISESVGNLPAAQDITGGTGSSPSTQSAQQTPTLPEGFTLKDKIGQLMFVGVTDNGLAANIVKKYEIGGILLNTGATYKKDSIENIKNAGKIPAFIAADEEGGKVDRLGLGEPSAKTMGESTFSVDKVRDKGMAIGRAMSKLSINVNFAPVVDLDDGQNTAISTKDRAFSDDPDVVLSKARAFADGLQEAGVIPTYKHFPGLGHARGSTGGNTDTGPATTPDISLSELKKSDDLKPYKELLKAPGQAMVMMGNQKVPNLTDGDPATMSKKAYALLRDEFNFGGVIITDDIGNAKSVRASRSMTEAVIDALKAGADMPLFNVTSEGQVESVINAVVQAVNDNKISKDQVANSLDRVIDLKKSGSKSTNAETPEAEPASACQCPGSETPDTGDASTSDDKVIKFLQALSFQENGGKVIGTSVSNAQGKFQYINSTWHSSAKAYYPPADKYASANQAPESVQDAVAYLEYVVKFKKMKGDVFKIAISHFYPAANANPGLLDTRPPNNVITPRQYANSVIKHMKNGDGKRITFKHEQAPEFKKWLAHVGGSYEGVATASPADSGGTTACQCPVNQTNIGSSTIVLDPGHGPTRTVRDVKTGLNMVEQPGGKGDEIGHAWSVANLVKKDLEGSGYKVLMTKKSLNDNVTFRERANVADKNKAVLALSIHGDSSLPDEGQIYVQKVGLYRGEGSRKTVFKDEEVATKSQNYAKIFKQEREKVGGGRVVIKDNVFDSRGIGMEIGNIPMVQLLSETPWVYHEKRIPFSDTEYAKELVAGVKKAVPKKAAISSELGGSLPAVDSVLSTDSSESCSPSGSVQAAVDLAMKYAWPDGPHGLTPNKAYAQAIASHPKEYKGGCNGADCGAFVTRVMRDSGADKKYNEKECNTACQKAYMDAHPNLYKNLGTKTSTAGLEAGDIAITANTHTYMFVGDQSKHPEFKGNSASASLCQRMPNASNAYFKDVEGVPFTWYRLKQGG